MTVQADTMGRQLAASGGEFHVTNAYRYYVVWLLFAVYVCNFIDRQILGIVMELIKRDFALADWQLGTLHGLAFAALYSTLGIPIAHLADRSNRVNIITASILIWSAFTAVTGFATNFWHLLIARIGVGVGEAGCTPPAHSIISDYFDPRKRAKALSIYSMGVYGGGMLGTLVGAKVAEVYGWRAAFFVVGLPGILIALIMKLTLREPPRGYSEPGNQVLQPLPFMQVVRDVFAKPSFRHLAFAAGLHSFASYGASGFLTPFLMRSHGMSVAQIAPWLAFGAASGGLLGTYLGGMLCDRYFRKDQDPRWYLWIPAITLFLNVPLGQVVYIVDNRYMMLWLLIPHFALSSAYLVPSIASTHRLVGLRDRALASALLLLILNFIGLGLGPMFTGFLSDTVNVYLLDQGVPQQQAVADGLRWAIRLTLLISLWAGVHYLLGARTLREEIASAERQRTA